MQANNQVQQIERHLEIMVEVRKMLDAYESSEAAMVVRTHWADRRRLPLAARGVPAVWAPRPAARPCSWPARSSSACLRAPRGPGKTDGLLMSFAQYVGRGFGSAWRGIPFRETYKQLADVVVKSKRWFRLFFPGARFLESASDYRWVFPSGEELLLRVGVKDGRRLLGLPRPRIPVDRLRRA